MSVRAVQVDKTLASSSGCHHGRSTGCHRTGDERQRRGPAQPNTSSATTGSGKWRTWPINTGLD